MTCDIPFTQRNEKWPVFPLNGAFAALNFSEEQRKAVINNWNLGGRNVNITTVHSLQKSGTYSIGRLIHLLSLTEWVRPAN